MTTETPHPDHIREALSRVPVRVHQDIILTDQMFIPAKEAVLLLPTTTRYEQEGGGTETTTERRVIFSPELPRQVGEARTEWRILRDLAVAVDPAADTLLGCNSGQEIRDEIPKAVPIYDGVQHLKKSGDQFQYGGPHLCPDGVCQTDSGKARLNPVELPSRGEKTNDDYPFKVSTRRGKQFNTLIYAEIDPLTGAGRDAVFMNPEDAAELRLVQGDSVTLVNDVGSLPCTVFLAPISRGNLQVHWPEGNAIIRKGVLDAGGLVPDYYAVARIEKTNTPQPVSA
jgi:anaerobic selenocysteine-containing dehydrogenase